MSQLHSWESTANEVFDWMHTTPDALAADIIGDHRPWEPKIPHDDAMAYHLEHLYPPEMGGQMDTGYVAHIMTTGTEDEVKTLGRALDRHVTKKAEQARGEMTGTPPYPELDRPDALTPRRY